MLCDVSLKLIESKIISNFVSDYNVTGFSEYICWLSSDEDPDLQDALEASLRSWDELFDTARLIHHNYYIFRFSICSLCLRFARLAG